MAAESLFSNSLFSGTLTDLSKINCLDVFSEFDEGVIIADTAGRIVFYNQAMGRIDDLSPENVLGQKTTDIYVLTDKTSVIMQCIEKGEPVVNHTFFYRTRLGKVANTIHSVFPLRTGRRLIGAICFVRDYNLLEKSIGENPAPAATRRSAAGTRYTFAGAIGSNPDFLRAIKSAQMACDTPSPIMLHGKTGTGKELFAQSIHSHSHRRKNRYIAINCAAIPENLLEGNLFGTARGAFTGAIDRPGLFENASGGTLFLDEVDSMPIGLQAKLLRALQEKKIRRVGSLKEIDIDIKIISSVSTAPYESIKKGTLRNDLFYRLGVVLIRLPALEERPEDLMALTRHFIRKNNRQLGTSVKKISNRVVAFFKNYSWPGNIRELEHVIEGAMNMVGPETTLKATHLSPHFAAAPEFEKFADSLPETGRPLSADAVSPRRRPNKTTITIPADHQDPLERLSEVQTESEKIIVFQALQTCKGNVTQAASRLGISRQLLNYKIKKYHFKRKNFTDPAPE